jgi:hypothetical protein
MSRGDEGRTPLRLESDQFPGSAELIRELLSIETAVVGGLASDLPEGTRWVSESDATDMENVSPTRQGSRTKTYKCGRL